MSGERTAATTRARPWRELAKGANGIPVGRGVDPAGFEPQRGAELPVRVHPRASGVGSVGGSNRNNLDSRNATRQGLSPLPPFQSQAKSET